jgi:hypothetical protein
VTRPDNVRVVTSVKVSNLPNRSIADAVIQMLRRNGIEASAKLQSGGKGVELWVREEDAAKARTLLRPHE